MYHVTCLARLSLTAGDECPVVWTENIDINYIKWIRLNLNLNLVQVGALNKNRLFQAILQNYQREDFVGQLSLQRKTGSISGKKNTYFVTWKMVYEPGKIYQDNSLWIVKPNSHELQRRFLSMAVNILED